jgi:hypothetical protein
MRGPLIEPSWIKMEAPKAAKFGTARRGDRRMAQFIAPHQDRNILCDWRFWLLWSHFSAVRECLRCVAPEFG